MIDRKSIHEFARYYIDGGIGVIPVRLDGSKAPALASWKEYQQRLARPEELERWFLCSDHARSFRTARHRRFGYLLRRFAGGGRTDVSAS